MWLLLFLLFSIVRADEHERPACAQRENIGKCLKANGWTKPDACGEGVHPECVQYNDMSCPSCYPKELKEDIMDAIPDAKRCFIEGMVEKCRRGKVEMGFCDDERPICQRKQVRWEDPNGEKPGMDFNVSCPSCVPEGFIHMLCKEKPTVPCEDDDTPEMKWEESKRSLCPSCFKIPKRDECADKRGSCVKKLGTLDKCADREAATKENCCFSCIPAKLPEVAKCLKKVKNLPDCEEDSEGGEDGREESKKVGGRDTDGCRSCAPPAPKRKAGEKCDREDFEECKENTPSCDAEEEPLVDGENLRCCPPCVRPASKAHLLRVIACRKFLPECGDDDDDDGKSRRNTFLPGEACPICEPRRPKCAQACGPKSVCIFDRREGEVKKKCVRRRRIKMILKMKKNVTKAIRDLDKETMSRLLKEFVSRFCEHNSEAERCANLKDRLLESLECTKKTNRDVEDEIEIEVELAEAESPDSRRLLAETGAAEQFLNDAAKDDPDYIASSELGAPEVPLDSSASSLNIFFISVFLSIAFFQF